MAIHLYIHTWGGSHSRVAKWDLRTQGGQVSGVPITGLNADTASASRRGGRNRFALASVHKELAFCKAKQAKACIHDFVHDKGMEDFDIAIFFIKKRENV